MTIPSIPSLLLPTLRMIAVGNSVEEIRECLKEQFKITPDEAEQTHVKSGLNVFVNRVAWVFAHLVMGKVIVLKEEGVYEITERGTSILKGNPLELTIGDLH